MATNAQTSAGAVIAIGDEAPSTYDKAGYEGVNAYSTIGEITGIGEFGKIYEIITFNALADRKTYKFKGSYDNGESQVDYAYVADATDTGQAALRAAVDVDQSYPIRIILNDGSYIYFSAMVTSAPLNIGTVGDMLMASTTLALDEDVLYTTAPAS